MQNTLGNNFPPMIPISNKNNVIKTANLLLAYNLSETIHASKNTSNNIHTNHNWLGDVANTYFINTSFILKSKKYTENGTTQNAETKM